MKNRPSQQNPTIPDRLPQMITVNELATTLGMSKRTIWRLLASGRIPEPVRVGGGTRWRLDVIRNWIDQGCPIKGNPANSDD